MGRKYRAQILLEPEQLRTLQQIAAQEGRSLSDIVREVIQIGLEARQRQTELLWQKRMEALERLNQIRETVEDEYGIYPGDLLPEARAERDSQTGDAIGWKPEV